MSSSYPPFGNVPAQLCQRCGRPLSPNEVTCGNCGQYNAPAQSNTAFPQSPSAMYWGGAMPQAPQALQQHREQPMGQYPVQSPQNKPFGGNSIPQRPFSLAGKQPGKGDFMGMAGQQPGASSIFGVPSQQSGGSSPSGAPDQAPNTANLSGSLAPPQPFRYQSSLRQPTGGLGPQGMNSFQSRNLNSFGQSPSQPLTGNLQSGNMYGFQTASRQSLSQSPSAALQIENFQQGNIPGNQAANFTRPPEKKKRPKFGLVIGLLLLLVLIVSGGLGGYVLLKKYSPASTTRVVPTVAPTSMPKGAALFKDSFTDNKNSWDLTSLASQYSVKLGNGSMILEDDNNRLLWELVPGGRNFSDFYLTVDASLSKGTQSNGYGIYIRGASNQNEDLATYYRFELYGDGTFAVFKGTVDSAGTSKSTAIVNFSTSSVVLKQGQVNHVGISARGSTMTFIVNGTILKTFTDNSYTGGSIALFVSNLGNTSPGAQATFSNLMIYPPQS